MNLVKFHRTFNKLKHLKARQYSQPAILDQNEYTETPEYPPIQDLSLQSRKARERQSVYDKIRKVKTIEEKQIALNMPRYYGWKCIMLTDQKVPYNAMPVIQFYTRSHFIQSEKLPDTYTETEAIASDIVKEIKSDVEDIIAIEHEGVERNLTDTSGTLSEERQKENVITKNIVRQINRTISNNLSSKASHILTAQVDYDPRHEAFWMVGGVDPPRKVVNWRKTFKWYEDRINEPINRPVQYLGTPMLTLRNALPLKPFIPYSEAENPEFKVPQFLYQPQTVGYSTEFRHGTNIPGYWPGDPEEFGLLSIHSRDYILDRKDFGPEDNIEALHCQALQASFGWLLAQANYQGFNTYNDVTYPLSTQTIITNGQLWSFYAYQLNTIAFHNDQVDNPKSNVCFGTNPLKLYESLENGKVNGLNEDVLKMIIQVYLNKPEERDYDMKPYLDKEEQVVADIEDDNKRCWLEDRFKHLVSNKPKHYLTPEIYHWEYIYKIQNKTRFFERKVRPFERGINPFDRKLNDHLPPYIPKALRPYPRCRKKFETTYYPDV
ncbi:hypothetical protein JYU34_015833 [Plutella xylostella]|uniref:28S ribosomal protein S30, mitochondrial n=1 Tax=Plutella xylostella TaxID=51655 RepID=A0ABQ7Q8K4_PLUXY|nr:hypothetical protein JYU34_015833 [Plutella xylostella]